MTVRRLRLEMPNREFMEWAAYYKLEAEEAERQARIASKKGSRGRK